MKKYVSSIHSSFIIRLLRMYCNIIEEDNEQIMKNFDDENEMKQYTSIYEHYQSNLKKLESYRRILENDEEIDFKIIND